MLREATKGWMLKQRKFITAFCMLETFSFQPSQNQQEKLSTPSLNVFIKRLFLQAWSGKACSEVQTSQDEKCNGKIFSTFL